MIMPPENKSECPICREAGRKGKIKVKSKSWGWEATCTNKECDYYNSYHSPNYGRSSWQEPAYGALF